MTHLLIAHVSPWASIRAWLRPWAQAGLLIALWMGADSLRRLMGLPLPGSVLGLLLVWTLLECRLMPLAWLEQGAESLHRHLALFFVPAMLALFSHPEFLSWLGLKILLAVLGGTLLVMAGTALVVEFGMRMSRAKST